MNSSWPLFFAAGFCALVVLIAPLRENTSLVDRERLFVETLAESAESNVATGRFDSQEVVVAGAEDTTWIEPDTKPPQPAGTDFECALMKVPAHGCPTSVIPSPEWSYSGESLVSLAEAPPNSDYPDPAFAAPKTSTGQVSAAPTSKPPEGLPSFVSSSPPSNVTPTSAEPGHTEQFRPRSADSAAEQSMNRNNTSVTSDPPR